MNTNQHTSAKGLNYFFSVKLLILGTNVSQCPCLVCESHNIRCAKKVIRKVLMFPFSQVLLIFICKHLLMFYFLIFIFVTWNRVKIKQILSFITMVRIDLCCVLIHCTAHLQETQHLHVIKSFISALYLCVNLCPNESHSFSMSTCVIQRRNSSFYLDHIVSSWTILAKLEIT